MAWHPEPKGQAEVSLPRAALLLKSFVFSSLLGFSPKSVMLFEPKGAHEITQNWLINYTVSRNKLPQCLLFY
jgi:hypothetical protein